MLNRPRSQGLSLRPRASGFPCHQLNRTANFLRHGSNITPAVPVPHSMTGSFVSAMQSDRGAATHAADIKSTNANAEWGMGNGE